MTNIPIPEPVAIYKPEYGICWTSSGMAVEAVDGIQFITTTQAEAYADAVRREALEEAASVAKQISDKYAYGYYGNEVDTADEIEVAIRALTPPQQ